MFNSTQTGIDKANALKWFSACPHVDDVKKRYRDLSLRYHPDMPGGDTALMQEIVSGYKWAAKNVLSQEQTNRKTGEKYKWTEKQQEEQYSYCQEFQEKIDQIVRLKGIEIDACGKFIWLKVVDGFTIETMKYLESVGFKRANAPKENMLFWHVKDWRKKSKRVWQYEDIARTFKTGTVKNQKDSELE